MDLALSGAKLSSICLRWSRHESNSRRPNGTCGACGACGAFSTRSRWNPGDLQKLLLWRDLCRLTAGSNMMSAQESFLRRAIEQWALHTLQGKELLSQVLTQIGVAKARHHHAPSVSSVLCHNWLMKEAAQQCGENANNCWCHASCYKIHKNFDYVHSLHTFKYV